MPNIHQTTSRDITAVEALKDQAERVLEDLQKAVLSLIESSPSPLRRAVDLQRALGVDAPLGWRLFRLAGAHELLAAAEFVPGRGDILALTEAMQKQAWSRTLVQRIEEAYSAYDRFLHEHAGSRRRLDTMLKSLRQGDEGLITERIRKGYHEHAEQVWGISAKLLLGATILHPASSGSGRVHRGVIMSYIDVHAIRCEAPQLVMPSVQPIGDECRIHDCSEMLNEFNSPGLEFRTQTSEDGKITSRVVAPGVGNRAAISVFSCFRSDESKNVVSYAANAMARVPAQAVHLELWLPQGWSDPSTSCMNVYGRRYDTEKIFERRQADIMPVREAVAADLGVTRPSRVSEFSHWPEVIDKALDELGCRGERFDVYRVRLSYPILFALTELRVNLV